MKRPPSFAKKKKPLTALRREILRILNSTDDVGENMFTIDPARWGASEGLALNQMPDSDRQLVANRLQLALNDLATGDILTSPLQSFAVGFPQNDMLEPETQFLAPDVKANARVTEYLDHSGGFGVESELYDERGSKAEFKTIDQKGNRVAVSLFERGLASEIDLSNYDDPQAEAQRRVQAIISRLQLNRLRRASAALIAIAADTSKVWSTAAGKDPDGDVSAELLAGWTATAVRATRAYYGGSAWSLRGIAHRAQNTAGGFASAGLTPEQLAAFLQLEGVMVSKALYTDGGSSIAAVTGGKVIMFRSFANVSPEDSSVLKTLWAPCNGQRYEVLPVRMVGDRMMRVAVRCIDKCVVTGPATNTVRTLSVSAS